MKGNVIHYFSIEVNLSRKLKHQIRYAILRTLTLVLIKKIKAHYCTDLTPLRQHFLYWF